MPSIFDTIFGTTPGGLITQAPAGTGVTPPSGGSIFDFLKPPTSNDPLDPAVMRRHQWTDGLAGLSQGLLAAGGPSLMPMDFGSALGKGLSGALTARDSGEDRYLKRALVGSQVEKARSEIAADKGWQDLLKSGGATTPSVSPVTPPVGAPTPLTPGAGASPGKIPAEWDPHYHAASARTGLSVELLKAKDLAESGGNANAVSPAGAAGPSQLMAGTAKDLGVTNRFDPAQAIGGGANYLKQMYDRYGKNADIALTAYNWGPGNVDNWIRTGADPNKLPAETKNYLAKIHANLGTAAPTFAGGTGAAQPGMVAQGPAAPWQGQPPVTAQGAAPPLPSSGAPGMVAQGVAPPLGPIAQPPVQLASAPGGAAPGMPPQGDTPPAVGPQMAQAPPVAPPPKTFQQILQTIPPGVRDVLATMPRKEGMAIILNKYADPETHPAIDTTTGAIVFAPKNDNSGRYAPVDAARIDLDKQRLDVERRQAAAREKQAATAERNAAVGPDNTPSPAVVEAAGLTEAAKEKAKQEAALDSDAAKTLVQTAVKDFTEKERPKALAVQEQIPGLHNIRRAIDAGAITGTGTTQRNTLAQLASTLGFSSNEAAITPSYIASMGQQILNNAKALGANPSNAEDKIIRDATGANPDTSKEGVLRLLDVQENLLRQAHKRYTAEAERVKSFRGVKSAFGDKYFDIPEPPTYGQWTQDNPLPAPAGGSGSLAMPPMNAIDAEIARRRKAGGQ